jgi:hypothetical protein
MLRLKMSAASARAGKGSLTAKEIFDTISEGDAGLPFPSKVVFVF